MSETKTDYKEGDHSQFIEYLFSQEPKDKGAIQLGHQSRQKRWTDDSKKQLFFGRRSEAARSESKTAGSRSRTD